MIPSLSEITALHHKHAPSEKVFDLVFTHSLIVKEIAEGIMEKKDLSIDKELAIAGALLHDIGAYKLISSDGVFDGPNYIRHGVEGYAILKEENYPEALCRIAIHHTGAGITKDDVVRQNLPLPVADYLAETMEEKLIMYADKFHSKDPNFNTFDTYVAFVSKYGEDKVRNFNALAELFGLPDLAPLVAKYNHPII